MKTQPNTLPRLLVLTALLLAVSPTINLRADAVEFRLSSECTSNKLTLFWSGAPAIELQQATNPANPVWLDVPGSKGMSFREIPMTNPMAFFRLVDKDPTGDIDADGLDEFTETNGWKIFIDTHGYGTDGLVERNVTSDPGLGDTDGDGIDDFWEWMLGTDPRATDTDGDGISDAEEWFKWHTSPTSVDTDGDARGPNHNLPPKAQLFDGNELSLLHTSPTLDDTDADGRTDYEEYDQPGRNLLVAQLPNLKVEIVDAVDVRLDVEYAEEVGTSREYGGELTTSSSTTDTTSSSQSINASLKIGTECTVGVFKAETKASAEFTVGWQGTWTSETSTSQGTENSYSDYTTDSRTRTETAASGSLSAGIRLVNTGPITYTLTDFGLTVRYWMPGGGGGTNGSFKTLATLVPALGTGGITLAPGDSTPVLNVEAKNLNASRVKEFIARPNSLLLEPAFYELENAEGLNFDYLEEITRWRTARVEIDFGNDANEEYRVATNVERNEDGSYAGVTMGNVLSNILHIPFQTTNIQAFVPTNATNERILYTARTTRTLSRTNGFWIVVWSGDRAQPAHPNFDQIVLQAGDQILLSFIRDSDGDGLFGPEEQHFGTYDTAALGDPSRDSDGDGLSDVFEARIGWDIIVSGRTNHVYSDPRQADQDGDGLTDWQEFNGGIRSTNNGVNALDPTKADTDNDGLADSFDPYPLNPAKVLRVKSDAAVGGNGTTWTNAFKDLQDALTAARNGQTTTNDPNDDVAEIWVATGTYKPTSTTNRTFTFRLVKNTGLYGGFVGTETKLSQRYANPVYNATVLSGDLLSNDASEYRLNTNSFSDNSYNVCVTDYADGAGSGLDGFTITGGNARTGGVYSYFGGGVRVAAATNTPAGPPPRLKNLLFRANHATAGGGLSVDAPGLTVSDCFFIQNSAESMGGGMQCYSSSGTILTNCQFIQNETRATNIIGGGALAIDGPGLLSAESCIFTMNSSRSLGGAVVLNAASRARISRSRFWSNTSQDRGGGLALNTSVGTTEAEVLQCIFVANTATGGAGGALFTRYNATGLTALYLLNSSFCSNSASGGGDLLFNDSNGTFLFENCASWGNLSGPINGFVFGSRVRASCGDLAYNWPGNGNIYADPRFVSTTTGDLHLQSGSPAIDTGNNYLDYYPTVPGFQLLPNTDLDGRPRKVDGNSDGTATVDMGAYERQGP